MKRSFAVMIALVLLACSAFSMAETERQGALPAYAYPGEDPMIGAIADYISENSSPYWDHEVECVAIPAPVILKTVMVDDTHADMYGNFWCMKYKLEGTTLVCVSGGAAAGIMHLEMADSVWTVAAVEIAGDGEDYSRDIMRFCNGDKELEKAYFSSASVQEDPLKSVRARFIREYVEANQLPVDSFQDPYWDAIMLDE